MFVSAAETAVLVGISKRRTYEAIRDGTIGSVRVGNKILVPKLELVRLAVWGQHDEPLWKQIVAEAAALRAVGVDDNHQPSTHE